jgi:hypothetical protein
MNELAIDRFAISPTFSERLFGTRETRKGSAFYGYALTLLALGVGWLIRDRNLISAESGTGYWLGIVGGSMMLLLLLYPLRKRFRALRVLGSTSAWFKTHMVFGVIGPVLVLYHSNFQLGSFNSQVALFCMLAVALSGVIGRYIYTHIHRGLYGRKTSLHELRQDLVRSLEQSHGLASLMPEFSARLTKVAAEVQGDAITGTLGMRASLWWIVRQYLVWWSLHRTAMRELRLSALTSDAIMQDLPRLRKTTARYIRRFVSTSVRVAHFTLYERMFSFWHVLHFPLFLMMVISALVHVLAVHMY